MGRARSAYERALAHDPDPFDFVYNLAGLLTSRYGERGDGTSAALRFGRIMLVHMLMWPSLCS